MNPLEYTIRFSSDTAGIDSAEGALAELGSRTDTTKRLIGNIGTESKRTGSLLSEMASRGGGVRQVFSGLTMASQGGVSAIFGLAQAIRGLWNSMAAGSGAIAIGIGLIVGLVTFLKEASSYYDKLSEASIKSSEALKEFDDRLKGLLADQNETKLSLDTQVRALEEIKQAYDDGTKSIEDYASAQKDEINNRKEVNAAGIKTVESQMLMAHANDPIAQESDKENSRHALEMNDLDAKRQTIQVDEQTRVAKKAELEKNIQNMKSVKGTTGVDEANVLQERIDRLTKEREEANGKIDYGKTREKRSIIGGAAMDVASVGEMVWGGITGQGVGNTLDKIHAENKALDKLPTAGTQEAQNKKSKEDVSRLDQEISQAEEERFKKLDEADQQRKKNAHDLEVAKVALDKLDGEELTKIYDQEDAAAEAGRAEAQDKLRIEKDILKTKGELRAQAEAETEAVKASGEARADSLEDEIAMTKIEQERAAAQVAKLRARVLSPAAGQAQDQADREAKREEDRVNKRIAAAEDAVKNKRGRGQWIEDALTLKGARQEAILKKAELNQLEIDAARAAKESRDALQDIQKTLLANLQIGGAGV